MLSLGLPAQARDGELPHWLSASEGGMELGNDGAVRVAGGLRREQCEYWAAQGFGPSFWWAN